MKQSTLTSRNLRLEKYRLFAEQTGRYYVHKTSPLDDINSIPRWGVTPVSKKINCPVLITGTGRCGTDFISKLFVSNNYDVPHEFAGSFGCSSHWFVTDSDWYPVLPFTSGFKAHIGQRKSDFIFDKTIHLVRHPLAAIKSITNIFRSTDYEFLESNNIVPPGIDLRSKKRFYRGMVIYYYVNKYLLSNFPNSLLIHIENIKSEIESISSFLNIPPLKFNSEKPTNTTNNILGFRVSKEDVTFNTLKAIDFNLASKIWDLSKTLNYSL